MATRTGHPSSSHQVFRFPLASLTADLLLAAPAQTQTEMPFALDWKFEAPAAPISWPSKRAISQPKG